MVSIINTQKQLSEWQEKEALLEQMIPLIGRLYRQNNVITSIYGRSVINQSVINLVKSHRFVRQTEGHELEPLDTLAILQVLDTLNLGSCHIDIGKLAIAYRQQQESSLSDWLASQLSEVVNQYDQNHGNQATLRKDVVLYGFGRIGRFLARILVEKSGGSPLALRAIVVRKSGAANDLVKRASLLRRDSVHGSFEGTISVDEENDAIIANGNYIQVIYANSPAEVDYTSYGIENAFVIDNTGVWRDKKGLSQHLQSKGVDKVLLTAPGKGDLKNIVYGINHNTIEESDRIVSAASCTTNAITPILKVINDTYGIQHGHVETIHSYTNDQNLIDNFHKGDRRGRSAPLNMVVSETGAAKAVAKALPELGGKLTGNAIRVPTPNVSLAILNLDLLKPVSRESLNEMLRESSLYSELNKQIDFVNSPDAVSSDFVGNRRAGIVDAKATIVSGQKAILYVWYDNEAGYSAQVMRLVQKMAGIEYRFFPA
ncbi:glyceraldehyde-3-phosphate dehydrogenase [Gynuella sp.]|uniref:glyceraldehyde-3-phosphate dehydrogenase n=1 Tax=Gynuella sp. TaxID=2969146 RepID=UPI003D0E29E5